MPYIHPRLDSRIEQKFTYWSLIFEAYIGYQERNTRIVPNDQNHNSVDDAQME